MCRTLAEGDRAMRAVFLSIVLAGSLGAAALANAPARSDRPLPRGVSIEAVGPAAAPQSQLQSPPAQTSDRPRGLGQLLGLRRSDRPARRPAGGAPSRAPAIATSARGSVCGVPEIKGEALGPIRGRGACGIAQPVRLSSVSGVGLTMRPTIDCPTARALNTWVSQGLKPAVGTVGGGVKALHIVGSYACRNRNNAKTGRLSEHAKGRAIDIRTIALKDGKQITVLDGWRKPEEGRILRRAHAAACGPFGTVLGPNANRFHRDHFHFDTARYRSGSYCR